MPLNGFKTAVLTGKSTTHPADYSPFGMLLPNRHESTNEYRYGFNGMEKDDEVSGEGNSYDFGARLYNPRVGRWMSTDAFESKFPSWSPYVFAFNNPLCFVDLDGNEPIPLSKLWAEAQKSETLIKLFTDLKIDKNNYSDYISIGPADGGTYTTREGQIVIAGTENLRNGMQGLMHEVSNLSKLANFDKLMDAVKNGEYNGDYESYGMDIVKEEMVGARNQMILGFELNYDSGEEGWSDWAELYKTNPQKVINLIDAHYASDESIKSVTLEKGDKIAYLEYAKRGKKMRENFLKSNPGERKDGEVMGDKNSTDTETDTDEGGDSGN